MTVAPRRQGDDSAQLIYGLHAVRAMLKRHPERVLEVRLAEQRDDPRAREHRAAGAASTASACERVGRAGLAARLWARWRIRGLPRRCRR